MKSITVLHKCPVTMVQKIPRPFVNRGETALAPLKCDLGEQFIAHLKPPSTVKNNLFSLEI
jgi:hypothetical protein